MANTAGYRLDLKKSVVPPAGIEPALLSEPDFKFRRVYQFRQGGHALTGIDGGGLYGPTPVRQQHLAALPIIAVKFGAKCSPPHHDDAS